MKKNKIVIIFLIVIVLFGMWMRVSGILSNSFAYTYDVGRDMLALNQIVNAHKIPLIGQTTGFAGIFYGPWWYYILIIPFVFFAGSPQGIALFIALSGVSTIILGYFFGKEMRDETLGLTIAGFIAVSQTLIGITTQIWNPNLAPFFTLVLLYLLLKVKNKSESLVIFFSIGILSAVMLDFEIVYGSLLLIGTILSCIFLLKKNLNVKKIIAIIAGFIIILSPRIFFEVRHNFLMTKNFLSLFTDSNASKGVFSIGFKYDHLLTLVDLWKETLAGGFVYIAIILMIGSLLSVFFYMNTRKDTEKFVVKMVLTMIGVFFFFEIFLLKDAWSHFLVGLPVLFIIMLAISIQSLQKKFKQKYIVIIIAAVLIFLNIKPVDLFASLQAPTWEGDAAVYRNQVAVIDYIYNNAHKKPFNYIVYTPPVHGYTYEYLFKWYGMKKYGYIPDEKKQSLFFVIMEPDFENPERLKDWLKVRQNDGKIQDENVIKGGITVQTRIH